MNQQIPLIDVKAQYAPLIPELKERFAEVLESGRFIFGPEVEAFEREAAAYLGVPHAIGVANGTDALVLALEALGIGRGDEVICPSFTFYATAEAIARVGATPVFADIDPVTLNLDPEDVAARITPRTKAIMPVHLFGRPAPLAELAALGLPLDRGRGAGVRRRRASRRRAICSTFSFFPTKNLFALGDGGLVAVPRRRGRRARPDAALPRLARQDRPSSSSGRTRGSTRSRRRCCASSCRSSRAGTPHGARPPRATRSSGSASWSSCPLDEPGHVYHMYVVRSPERDRIARGARARPGSPAPRTT